MNIALGAVIIFILLLPPIAFYLSYTFGRFPKAGPTVSILEGLMISAIFAVFVHAVATYFFPHNIRFDVLALLIGGDLKGFSSYLDNREAGQLFRQFTLYNFAILLIMALAGRTARALVLTFTLHSRTEFFRLYNHWWYLFHGFKVDETISNGRAADFDIVFVDALVNTQDGTMIYSGYLIDFVCRGETLERIYLSEASKRSFTSNAMTAKGNIRINQPGLPVQIEGDTVALNFANIINLNLHFVTFPDELEVLQDIPDTGNNAE